MFSFVNNTDAPSRLREVNPTDASLREKKEAGGFFGLRLNKSPGEQKSQDAQSDGMILSTAALTLYFESLVERRLFNEKNRIEDRYDSQPWFKENASNDSEHASPNKAALAYKHALKTQAPSLRGLPHNLDGEFSTKEVYDLVQDLRGLREKGVLTLRIETKKNFVVSVMEAVEKRKQAAQQT
ncbi:MAG: hypothetical protein GC137_02755 [Alphaproteobacteria bacterium]|nr:hypothetical protein [Alphaproteobacteria bacterium]